MRIVFTGGGTAGHVTPLLGILSALSHAIRNQREAGLAMPELEVLWIGSERIESKLVPDFARLLDGEGGAGLSLRFLEVPIRFSWRRPSASNLAYYRQHLLPILLGVPFGRARQVLRDFAPGVVVASGGYVSAPTLWAAGRLGLRTALVQLDGAVGMVNAHFASAAWRVYCANDAAANMLGTAVGTGRVVRCGYPCQPAQRSRDAVMRDYGLDPSRRLLLVMGGSLGSGEIQRALGLLLETLSSDTDPRWEKLAVLCVGGERGISMTPPGGSVNHAGSPTEWGRVQFAKTGYDPDGMGLMRAADYYLGRSGAASVGELKSCGIPALLLPDMQHADRQQLWNARELELRGQARVCGLDGMKAEDMLDWLKAAWNQPRTTPELPDPSPEIARDLLSLLEQQT